VGPVLGVVVGACAGGGYALSQRNVYEASTSVIIVPQRVPDSFVRSTVTAGLTERLSIISKQVLSRTRLERIVQEFDLYAEERRRMIMEDVIELMRTDIALNVNTSRDGGGASSFSVRFQSPDPRTAMRVTERLASLFVQENLEDRELLADQTNQFLHVNLEEKRRQLSAHDGRLAEWRRASTGLLPSDMAAEHEVLVESYRSLLRKADEARLAVNLERRQIGEQFKILEGARMPERPIGPNRALVTFRGALIGLLAGALMSPVSAAWRRRRSS